MGLRPTWGEEDEAGLADEHTAAEPAAASSPGIPPPPTVVPRWIQAVVLPLALLGLWALARAAGTVLIILLVASVIALILNPIVRQLELLRVPRGLAILLIYLAGFAALGGIGVLLSDPISTQVTHLQHDVPSFIKHANHDLANVQKWMDRNGINIKIQQQGQTALQTLQKDVLKRSSDIVSFSQSLLQSLVTIGFDFVLTLVLSVYLLVYGREIGALARRLMPPGDGTAED
ncbi:MAG TPA: AI-2E family transporter, partial [Solirubrobacteraceae bacterium]|nr:AI-2E family transporter [Solirubrobacteraceae bacterium]